MRQFDSTADRSRERVCQPYDALVWKKGNACAEAWQLNMSRPHSVTTCYQHLRPEATLRGLVLWEPRAAI